MVDFVFTSKKQYWAAIKNLTKSLNSSSKESEKIRNAFANMTGEKKYKQKIYEKSMMKEGKGFSLQEVRKSFGAAKREQEKILKEEWKKARNSKDFTKSTTMTWKEYKEMHQEPDYDSIQEGYNSPK